ncbi:hypothetical protein LTS08_004074 [Lithohypha guttulata]|uniref:Uncharacterized protein n=1 Tax=Lithohypha guttulata TaxID=1690604 RepID=A0AAN7T2E2_9EURO|nr:hypothetical protein LTR05_003786 [Lithohypha guttulata]KAK5101616.1 hypothetical protein LTS08_004074 [Lithohypha guttulata]
MSEDAGLSKSWNSSLRMEAAVDRVIGGLGKVQHGKSGLNRRYFMAVDRDIRLYLAEHLARAGVKINWDHKLASIEKAHDEPGAELLFKDGQIGRADIVVNTGGMQAAALQQSSTLSSAKVLPYATYYGTRRVYVDEYLEKYASFFRDGNWVEIVPETPDTPYVSMQMVCLPDSIFQIRWIFSRPARGDSDPLFRPQGTIQDASKTPPEFFEEFLGCLGTIKQKFPRTSADLLQRIFSFHELKKDRILQWYLRLQVPDPQSLVAGSLKDTYHVIPIGDAARRLPFLRSHGARLAMDDALFLASWFKQRLDRSQNLHSMEQNFYNLAATRGRWLGAAVAAIEHLRDAHGQKRLDKAEMEAILGVSISDIVDASTTTSVERLYGTEAKNIIRSTKRGSKLPKTRKIPGLTVRHPRRWRFANETYETCTSGNRIVPVKEDASREVRADVPLEHYNVAEDNSNDYGRAAG